ncbi:MAG: polysaccharide export protein [Microcystis wesenbergii Mw_QC_S_20081001_S30D]|uniref:Polysaccharide export protein n=1 Tax=Microcystis wesenbergii Mw_QC_S_20081001_S30D TaxID=2486245 RepID=A0A552JMG3_9CHRO|nr:polysaccharide export protein [Microcystis aeruginosa W11-03]NCR94090.1 polysaccharide export protein [Microcystis aeruginosa W11-06]TRU95463.1 MAG: polysaccharide export protein [Microcystis wesenbergii Mw_QC_B_20070930_S4D]TRU96644.1 MAG: polysaccharide export protein [Microcystis wesenbergii Mw_QC_S_20081001_S30D]TRV05213.1 MAG: polysaccharide export protein [Microcystis wesenbergii Mw_QC_S_20081001_S30]TRV08474.1 MAG: polysaccharide export protein [Microcystis wesenbergii Mw_QC_B_200709
MLNKFLPVSLFRTRVIVLSGLSLTGFLWVIHSESLKAQGPLSIPQTQPGSGLEFLPPQPPNPTFPENTIPPTGYSPPVYSPNDRQSRQIQTYRLDVGDQISVSVTDFPEFNSAGPVDPDGNFLVPILGRIPVIGLTLDEVQTKIRLELGRKYLREEPEVIAVLTGPRPVQLTILGEVQRPGFYSVAPNTPLAQVLLAAGGGTPRADLRSIVVRRVLVDGTVLEEKLDLYTPLVKGDRLPDLRLQGGDAVIVSKLEAGQETGYNRTLVARTTLTQQNITIRVLAPLLPSGIALRNVSIPNGSTFLDVVASLPVSDRLRINVDEVSLLRFDSAKGGIVSQTLSPIAAVRGDISQNVPLEDQDVIIVSRTLLGKIFAAFNIITQPIRDITSFTNTILNISNQFDNFQ